MKELLTAIYDNFRQRLTNPLLGSYASFWAVYNSSFLYYFLMEDHGVKVKTRHLAELYNQNFFWTWGAPFLNSAIPLALAVAYVVGFPWVQLIVQGLQNIPHKMRMTEVADLEAHRLDSLEASERVKAKQDHMGQLMRLEAEVDLQKKRLDAANLKNEADKLEAENNTHKQDQKTREDKLAIDEQELEIKSKEQTDERAASASKGSHPKNIQHTALSTKEDATEKMKSGLPRNTKIEVTLSGRKIKKTTDLNVRDVELFEKTYELGDMKPNRVVSLIDYIIDDLKIKDFSPSDEGKNMTIASFIGYVKRCDFVTMNTNKNKPYIPFDAIKRIQSFQSEKKFPKSDEEWNWFLMEAYPKFTENDMKYKLNEWTRKLRKK